MANQGFDAILKKLIVFVTDKKKLPLLLLLLGGGATVVTGTVLLANPGNGGSDVTSSGGNTSQGGGSVVPFSGDDVPEWDFDNATLDGDATTVGVGYDFNWFQRYQDEYFYQVGRNFFEGAPTTGNVDTERYTEMLFSIYNTRTSEVEFLYHFEISAERKAHLLEVEDYDYSYMWLRIAYDQQDTILALLTIRLPYDNQVALGGSYAPIESYITTNFDGYEESYNEYTLLLQFDINDNTQYTILDAFDAYDDSFRVEDILIEDNSLFLSAQVSKETIDNPMMLNNQAKFGFLDIPEAYPTFNNYSGNSFNPWFSYIVELDASDYTNLTTIETTSVTTDGNSNIWFYGFRQGFETKYFNEIGEMALGLNGSINSTNQAAITSYFDALETNFLSTEESERILPLIEAKAIEFYDRTVAAAVNNSVSMYINFGMFGFYNFETGNMTKTNYSANSWESLNINGVSYQFNNSFYSQVISMSNGETFKIESDIAQLFVQEVNYWGGWSGLNPDYREYAYSSLSSIDIETNEETLIEENEDNGKYITNIYQKNGGYYVSGTYYQCDERPDTQSTDAFLLELDENFEVVNELVLAGSGDDNGSQIVLNNQSRPVWLVSSNSTDGDFAEAAASNTDGRYKTYSVSF